MILRVYTIITNKQHHCETSSGLMVTFRDFASWKKILRMMMT